jgi:YggT family protein
MNSQGALEFLVDTILDLAAFLMLTRFLLQWVRADFYNPLSQAIVRITNPLLMPLRKILPASKQYDFAALVLVLMLIVVKILFIAWLGNFNIGVPDLLLYATRALASMLLDYIFWAILIRVLMSWIMPDPYNPFVQIMVQITEPVMAPARRVLPPFGGLDLSPILVLFLIQFLEIWFKL